MCVCVCFLYSPMHKGYRCLDELGRVYILRSTVFNESCFPYNDLFSQKPNETILLFNGPNAYPISVPQIPLRHSLLTSKSLQHANANTDHESLHNTPVHSPHHHKESHNSTSEPQTQTHAPQLQIVLLFPPHVQQVPHVHSIGQTVELNEPNTHSIVTRSKAGISKPKVFNTEFPICEVIEEHQLSLMICLTLVGRVIWMQSLMPCTKSDVVLSTCRSSYINCEHKVDLQDKV